MSPATTAKAKYHLTETDNARTSLDVFSSETYNSCQKVTTSTKLNLLGATTHCSLQLIQVLAYYFGYTFRPPTYSVIEQHTVF